MSVLVLLVGMNPLPNWVVFKSLMEAAPNERLRPEKVLLVHSHDTVDTAGELQMRMRALGVPVVRIALENPRDGNEVQIKLREGYEQHAAGLAVHLNYTGGTKEMAVSAYAATQKAEKRAIGETVFSYLDAKSHRLRWHAQGDAGSSNDLRAVVHVGLAELIALHRRELDNPPPRAPIWPGTADALFRLHAEGGESLAAFKHWRWREFLSDGTLEQPAKPSDLDGALFPGNKIWRRGVLRMPPESLLPGLRRAFQQEAGTRDHADETPWEHFFPAGANTDTKNKAATKVAGYFHGKWLENWLWSGLARIIGTRPGWQLTGNVKAHRTGAAVNAELDVVAINGYQLYVFSCTTGSNRDRAKNKAFEVLRRSQQFGGDEARAILVTLLPLEATGQDASVRNLTEDLVDDSGGSTNLAIWGMHELVHLDESVDALLEEAAS